MVREPNYVSLVIRRKLAQKHQPRVSGITPLIPKLTPQQSAYRLIANMVHTGARFDEVHYTLSNGIHDSYYNQISVTLPDAARLWLISRITEVRNAMRLSLKIARWITITPERWKGQKGLSEKNVQ